MHIVVRKLLFIMRYVPESVEELFCILGMMLPADKPHDDVLDCLPFVRFGRSCALAHRSVQVSRIDCRLNDFIVVVPQGIERPVFPLVEYPSEDTRKQQDDNQQQQYCNQCSGYDYDHIIAHCSLKGTV